jgi:type IV secretory pathway VirB2 component (pilin)
LLLAVVTFGSLLLCEEGVGQNQPVHSVVALLLAVVTFGSLLLCEEGVGQNQPVHSVVALLLAVVEGPSPTVVEVVTFESSLQKIQHFVGPVVVEAVVVEVVVVVGGMVVVGGSVSLLGSSNQAFNHLLHLQFFF